MKGKAQLKIKVKASSSADSRTFVYPLNELGVSEKEWNNLGHDERKSIVIALVDTEEQPYWQVESFE